MTTYQIRAIDDGGAQDFNSLYGSATLDSYDSLSDAEARCAQLNALDPGRGYYVEQA